MYLVTAAKSLYNFFTLDRINGKCNKIRNRRDLSETENARPIVRRAFYECLQCYYSVPMLQCKYHQPRTGYHWKLSWKFRNKQIRSLTRSWLLFGSASFVLSRLTCPTRRRLASVVATSPSCSYLVRNTHESGIWTTYYSIYYYLSMRLQQQPARSEGGGSERANERARKASPHSPSKLLYIAYRVEKMWSKW